MLETASKDGSSTGTLGGELERHRLEQRARRLELVIAVLRERAGAPALGGSTPSGLQHAIRDFAGELARVRRRLSVARVDDPTRTA